MWWLVFECIGAVSSFMVYSIVVITDNSKVVIVGGNIATVHQTTVCWYVGYSVNFQMFKYL